MPMYVRTYVCMCVIICAMVDIVICDMFGVVNMYVCVLCSSPGVPPGRHERSEEVLSVSCTSVSASEQGGGCKGWDGDVCACTHTAGAT